MDTPQKHSAVFRVGIVGHRYLADPELVSFVAQNSLEILKRLEGEHKNLRVISAIAEGADTVFAEKAVELHIPLEIVRPFEDYAIDFATPSANLRYERLRSCASSEIILPHAGRSDAAYLAGMYWIVDNCSLVVAVWDGSPARGSGGTGDAIDRAIEIDCDWIHINVADLSVTHHSK